MTISVTGSNVNICTPTTFATLPAAASGNKGSLAAITDSTTISPGAIATGGGSSFAMLVSDGSNWVVFGPQAALSIGYAQTAIVTSQFDKTNDTTLGDITGLSIPLLAGYTYIVRAILYTIGATCGIKAAFGAASGLTATSYRGHANAYVSAGGSVSAGQATSLGTALVDATQGDWIGMDAEIAVNAAGNLTCQFAQHTSSATTGSVRVGSHFVVELVS